MTATREISWLSIILAADPDFQRNSRFVTEYEFNVPGAASGNELTHEEGMRVFKGDYTKRGPYAPDD